MWDEECGWVREMQAHPLVQVTVGQAIQLPGTPAGYNWKEMLDALRKIYLLCDRYAAVKNLINYSFHKTKVKTISQEFCNWELLISGGKQR
jgi:hypothetical protein